MNNQESVTLQIKKEIDDFEQFDNNNISDADTLSVTVQQSATRYNGSRKKRNACVEDNLSSKSAECAEELSEGSIDIEGINLLKYFKKSSDLYEKSSDGDEYVCRVCKRRYDTLWRTRIHVRTHFESKSLFCEVCCKRFLSSDKFNNHRCVPDNLINETEAGENVSKKQKVASSCSTLAQTFAHSDICVSDGCKRDSPGDEAEKGPHVCNICNKTLSGKKSLKLHMYQHSDEPPFVCNLCDKGFFLPAGLQSHMRLHNGDMFKCTYCPMEFSRTNQLKRHLRQHTGERPFVCKICDASYTLLSTLKDHMRKHSGDFYRCEFCGKKFTQAQNLKKHKLRKSCGGLSDSDSVKPFGCQFCPEAFSSPNALYTHLESHTASMNYACPKCETKYSSIGALVAHYVTHYADNDTGLLCPFPTCRKQFNNITAIDRHVTMHFKKPPLTCSVCTKEFTSAVKLRQHFEFHTGAKTLLCPICGLALERETSFQSHLRRQHGQSMFMEPVGGANEVSNQSDGHVADVATEDGIDIGNAVSHTMNKIGEFEQEPGLDSATNEIEHAKESAEPESDGMHEKVQVKIELDIDEEVVPETVQVPTELVKVKLEPGLDSNTVLELVQVKTEPDDNF